MLPKRARLKILLERLETALPAASADEALELLSKTLNAVEDEFSGIEYNPDAWIDDGRMYPPREDSRRELGSLLVRRYRSAGHNTIIGVNGAIRVQDLHRKILLDKPGADGRQAAGDLDVETGSGKPG